MGLACVALPSHGATRYANDGSTVTDNKTGLVWQKAVPSTTYDWNSAKSYCQSLSLAGGGWRLPTIKELQTLVDYSVASPGPAIDPVFSQTPADIFWSSTPFAGNASDAWVVTFSDGECLHLGVTTPHAIRCVRK